MFCNTIKDRREKHASFVAVPRWIFSWEGKPSWPSMYEHVIILSRHRTALSFYQGTTIYIVYIHIINTLLYMNKLFQFIHIMKFFRLLFQSRGRMTTVFVVFLLCCAGNEPLYPGPAGSDTFWNLSTNRSFRKKISFYEEVLQGGARGALKSAPPCPSL